MKTPEFGLLPKEYNVRVHGAYFPGYNYGKKETPVGELKLAELPAWIKSRSRNPADWIKAFARFTWRYRLKWFYPRRATMVPFFQICSFVAIFQYFNNFSTHRTERHAKYH
ncbi:unnamed protein product [Dibothriocephalus latus]|uniref:ATP synthase subunit f, mitochondrial n=1 Tax=Dibothriocephalus latus TaxID=60516 RepID=A0A3P7PFG7_DIBLA|nr:unnamed protein product [Dibothriocephalus latus]